MPWYKLFDQSNDEQQWDGVLRFNKAPLDSSDDSDDSGDSDDLNTVWFPAWVAEKDKLTPEIVQRAYQMGPYYQPVASWVGKILDGGCQASPAYQPFMNVRPDCALGDADKEIPYKNQMVLKRQNSS